MSADEAARLLSAPTNPAEVDPVRFHLFHKPDGRDVLLIQYNHTLLDHHDAILLLRQLDDDPLTAGAPPIPPRQRWRDPIWNHLRHVPRARRRAAALAAERLRQSLRGGAVRLARQHPAGGPVSFRIAMRRLEPAQTIALRTHITRCCGVPSLSMGVLASAFRAINRLAGAAPGEYLSAGIGVDLGLTRGGAPAMQNLSTLVPIQVASGALGNLSDRDALIRTLNQQLRARLANDIDVGVLELAAVFGRRQHQAQWAIELLFRYCASLWYGSFGPLRGLGPAFCGAPIEQAFFAGPAWPPVGITLLVNEFAGRLHLQATYIRQCVPDSLANAFLDVVLSDFALPNEVV